MKNQLKSIKPLIGYFLLLVALVNVREYTIFVIPAFVLFLVLTDTFKKNANIKEEQPFTTTVNKQFIARTLTRIFLFVRWSVIIGMLVGIFYANVIERIFLHMGSIDKTEVVITKIERPVIFQEPQIMYTIDYGKYNIYAPYHRKGEISYDEYRMDYEIESIVNERDMIKASIIRDTLENVLFPTIAGVFLLLCLFGLGIFCSNWIKANS